MDTTQNRRDLITYAALWVGSLLLYFWLIPNQIELRSTWSGDAGFTSRSFPNLLAGALFVVSTLGIIQSGRKLLAARRARAAENHGAGEEDCKRDKSGLVAKLFPLFTYLICFLYVVLFQAVGFIIATLIVCPALLLLFRAKKWSYFVSVYAFGACLYFIFRVLLKVPLP